MQQRHSRRASLPVISTTVTLCSVASQTVCSGAYSLCRTRQRDSSPVLVDVTTSHQCWGNSTGFRFDSESISSWPLHDATAAYLVDQLPACLSRRPSPAPIGWHRHVLRSTDQHMARRSELRSRWTTALEQSASQDSPARQRHRRISSAAEVVFV